MFIPTGADLILDGSGSWDEDDIPESEFPLRCEIFERNVRSPPHPHTSKCWCLKNDRKYRHDIPTLLVETPQLWQTCVIYPGIPSSFHTLFNTRFYPFVNLTDTAGPVRRTVPEWLVDILRPRSQYSLFPLETWRQAW